MRCMDSEQSRQRWIDQAARLMRIFDPSISDDHARALASALWERPGAEQAALERVAGQLAAARTGRGPQAPAHENTNTLPQ